MVNKRGQSLLLTSLVGAAPLGVSWVLLRQLVHSEEAGMQRELGGKTGALGRETSEKLNQQVRVMP